MIPWQGQDNYGGNVAKRDPLPLFYSVPNHPAGSSGKGVQVVNWFFGARYMP